MTNDELFFYRHAGYGWNPKVETSEQGKIRNTLDLARAEKIAEAMGWDFEVSEDPDVMDDDAGSVDLVASGEYVNLMILLRDEDGMLVGALGGIVVKSDSDPYVRVCKAEIASEAVSEMLSDPDVKRIFSHSMDVLTLLHETFGNR